MQNKSEYISVLHIYNRKHVKVDKIIKTIKQLGINIKALKDEDFSKFIKNNLSKKAFQKNVQGIINDINIDKKLSYKSNMYIKSDFSVDFLAHCKFRWSRIDKSYLVKYINYLKEIKLLED